ncbi:uncharacterized protein LOC126812595 [Patella vulgata]|uniref:uncharacterized protein LOC126812595 n=1 Tax=Patella vulgata TaxID=6465 RepID=UPI0024A9FC1D|nr:uncharacterized protein LOC126812595 [Patella vulgata]
MVPTLYFKKCLLRAMYLLAFHAFLRIGEISSADNRKNVLQFENVQFRLLPDKLPGSAAGLNTHLYKAHSFRIGAASAACSGGHSMEAIQRMGRWNSDAYKKYIRIPVLQL